MIEIFLLFILPIIIIYLSPYLYKKRVWIFGIVLLLIAVFIVKEKYTPFALGFRLDNILESIVPYMLLTITGLSILIFTATYIQKSGVTKWWKHPHFLYGFIFVSFFQELIFRGYLIPKMESLTPNIPTIVTANSLVFAFIHIIYPNKLRNFTLSFIGGIFFSLVYIYYPNIYLATASHAILNFTALYYSLVGPNDLTGKTKSTNTRLQKNELSEYY